MVGSRRTAGRLEVIECRAVDPWTEETRPGTVVYPDKTQPAAWRQPRRRRLPRSAIWLGLLLGLSLSLYLMAPFRTNLLLLGVDRTPAGTVAGRTDTMILTTFLPARPYVGALSIPRDLWVQVPDVGMNRINTAHYFAELNQPGSGLAAAEQVVRANFGVDVDYSVRVQFDGIVGVVDALGGLPIDLDTPMSGYPAGRNTLDGTAALAFVRDRAGSDDFARMGRGQLFLRSLLKRIANPTVWPRLPRAVATGLSSVTSDVPVWKWPRLLFVLVRVGPAGIDSRVIDRSMAVGFTTAGGAQVLAPQWDRINPVLLEMFGQ
jgi:LCP family protein required for cell wall assembly